MISSIRNGMTSSKAVKYFLWGALLAIPGGSLLVGLMDRVTSKTANSIALVNGAPISSRDLRLKAHQYQETLKRMAQFFPPEMLGNPVDLALNDLIQEQLLLDAAHAVGFKRLSTDFVNEKLEDPASGLLPKELYDSLGKLNYEMLEVFLRRQGMTTSFFEDQVEAILKRQNLMNLLKSIQYTPQTSLKSLDLREHNSRDFVVLSLKLDDYIKQSRLGKDSESAIKEYFKQKNSLAQHYWIPEKRSGTVWSFKAETYGAPVTDKDIKVYYARNKEKFGDKNLESVRPEIVKKVQEEKFKMRFATDARRIIAQHKDNPKALELFVQKHNGQKQMVAQAPLEAKNTINKKLFDLSRVGKAGVVTGNSEGSIIILDQIDASYEPNFEEVREQVANDFHAEQGKKRIKDDLAGMKKELTANNVAEIAKKWNAAFKAYTIASTDSKAWEQLGKEKLPVNRMKNMIHEGYTLEDLDSNRGHVVVLQKITPSEGPTEVEDAPKQALIRQNESLSTSAFIASLQNNATIIYNEIQTAAVQ